MTATELRRFREAKPAVRAGERCDLCAEPLGDAHGHLVDVHSRSLRCACRDCYPLFTGAIGRFRAVPSRYRRLRAAALADETWDAPVGMAFAFLNSATSQPVAFYPSPAGATESLLPATAWAPLLASAEAADLEPDVEALLVRRRGGPAGGADDVAFEAYLVPIDACYELVGLVRSTWKGFDGGTEARSAIAAFFARLDGRAAGNPEIEVALTSLEQHEWHLDRGPAAGGGRSRG